MFLLLMPFEFSQAVASSAPSSIIARSTIPGKENGYQTGALTFKVRFLDVAQRAPVLTMRSL